MANGLHRLAVVGTLALVSAPVLAGVVVSQAFWNEGRDAVREDVFATSCVQYKAASKLERWTTYYGWKMGWCEDYLDRV